MHPNQLAFIRGVHLIFTRWTALNLACTCGFVHDAEEKRDWFEDVIVQHFNQRGPKIDELEMEDILLQIMGDEFGCLLEDDSAYQVSLF